MPQISPHEQQIAPRDLSVQDRYLDAVNTHVEMVESGQAPFDEGTLRPYNDLYDLEADNLSPDMKLLNEKAGCLADEIEGKNTDGPQDTVNQIERLRLHFVGPEQPDNVSVSLRVAEIASDVARIFKVTLDENPAVLGDKSKYIDEKVTQIETMNEKRQRENIGGTALLGSDSLDIQYEGDNQPSNPPTPHETLSQGPEYPPELPNPTPEPDKPKYDDPRSPHI